MKLSDASVAPLRSLRSCSIESPGTVLAPLRFAGCSLPSRNGAVWFRPRFVVHKPVAAPYEGTVTETPQRQPIFNVPRTIVLLIGAMAAIHGLRIALSDAVDADLLARFAFVPARLTTIVDPAAVTARLDALAEADQGADGPGAFAAFFLGTRSPQPWTVLTYAVLHGNWLHLGLNGVWLLVFGAPVANRLAPSRFLALFAVSAVAGAAAHAAVDPLSFDPLIGASAAVSGCMGAALRFMFQPGRRGLSAGSDAAPAHLSPRLSLRALLRDRRAVAFTLVWFVTNAVTGVWAVPLGLSAMPIAWQAHVGGFLLGLLAFPLFDPVGPESRAAPPPSGTDVG